MSDHPSNFFAEQAEREYHRKREKRDADRIAELERMTACFRTPFTSTSRSPMSDSLPNPLPQPTTGPINRITPQEGNGATPVPQDATPAVPTTIGTVEDCLAFLAAQYSCVVIAVSRKRVGQPAGSKPLAVSVLHAGEAQDALKLASVAAGVLQGA